MEPWRHPNPASRAHVVLVSNEDGGSDPQLEEAVEVALQEVEEQPWPFLPVPACPRRQGP